MKFDGFRIQLHKWDDEVRLFSRNGKDFTDRFPTIAAAVFTLPTAHAVIDDGEIGYDIQTGGWVVAVEGDFSWTNFGDSATTTVPADPDLTVGDMGQLIGSTDRTKTGWALGADTGGVGGRPQLIFTTNYKIDWISTVRGRIGIPFDHFLIYGTGGLAFADVSPVWMLGFRIEQHALAGAAIAELGQRIH